MKKSIKKLIMGSLLIGSTVIAANMPYWFNQNEYNLYLKAVRKVAVDYKKGLNNTMQGLNVRFPGITKNVAQPTKKEILHKLVMVFYQILIINQGTPTAIQLWNDISSGKVSIG